MTIYRFDPLSRIHWLEFDGKPDQDTITLLKKEGWKWSSYRKQWRTNRRFAKPPVGIEYEDGGECDYSAERSDRLQNASERASERSESAYERSNGLIEGIPLGQPIFRGTRSGRQHEKTLEQSRRAMDTSVQEQKKAEHLEYKARSSARHQIYKERPDVIYRRIKRLKAEITSIENSHQRSIIYTVSEVKYGSITEDEAKQKIEASKKWRDEHVTLIQEEVDDNQAVLDEKGGIPADSLNVEIGDVIHGGWRGLCEVKKINTRKGELLSYTCQPLDNTWCSKYVIPKDEVTSVAVRKADVTSESVVLARLEAKSGHTYKPPVEPQEREFKAKEVEVVDLYVSKEASFFPTPKAIAEQLVQKIPHDAYLILEPSAGAGSLANAATQLLFDRGQNHRIHCCEELPVLRRTLEQKGYMMVGSDFLEYKPDDCQYDAIIMNPPFNGTTWLTHIEHAYELLKPGGTLAAIVPSGFAFNTQKRMVALRKLVEDYGECEHLPEDAFKESGTAVRTIMIWLEKPALITITPIVSPEPVEACQVSLW